MRLLVKKEGLYTYPDVMLICGSPDYIPERTDTLTNPLLIAEVLSDSTEKYDRGQRFKFYRTITTLKHYLLFSQDEI